MAARRGEVLVKGDGKTITFGFLQNISTDMLLKCSTGLLFLEYIGFQMVRSLHTCMMKSQ
jgi:hypothetical protein